MSDEKSYKSFGSTGRRKFLQMSATSVAGLSLTSNVSAKRQNDVISIRGSFENPVSESEINEAHATLRDNHHDSGGDVGQYVPYNDPESAGNVVAHIATIDNSGSIQSYTASAKNKQSVGVLTARANSKQEQFEQKATTDTATTSSYSTAASSYWSTVSQQERDEADYPYGLVNTGFYLKFLENDGDTGKDSYLIENNFQLEPGENKYGTGYFSLYAKAKHDWSVSSDNPELKSFGPKDDDSGSASVNIGTGGVGYSYSFATDGTTIDNQSSKSAELGKWEMTYNSYEDRFDNKDWTPGSTTVINQGLSGSGSKPLVDCTNRGFFDNNTTGDPYVVDYTWYLSTKNY